MVWISSEIHIGRPLGRLVGCKPKSVDEVGLGREWKRGRAAPDFSLAIL